LRDVQPPDVPGINDDQLAEPRHFVHASSTLRLAVFPNFSRHHLVSIAELGIQGKLRLRQPH
jgi:hypothetical protein